MFEITEDRASGKQSVIRFGSKAAFHRYHCRLAQRKISELSGTIDSISSSEEVEDLAVDLNSWYRFYLVHLSGLTKC